MGSAPKKLPPDHAERVKTLRLCVVAAQTDATGMAAMLRARGVRGADARSVRRMLNGENIIYDDLLRAVKDIRAKGEQGPIPVGEVGSAPDAKRVIDLTDEKNRLSPPFSG